MGAEVVRLAASLVCFFDEEELVMTWDLIHKAGRPAVAPNLADYESECRAFSWEAAQRSCFRGLPGGRGLNIAYDAVDRHLDGPRRDQVALRAWAKTIGAWS